MIYYWKKNIFILLSTPSSLSKIVINEPSIFLFKSYLENINQTNYSLLLWIFQSRPLCNVFSTLACCCCCCRIVCSKTIVQNFIVLFIATFIVLSMVFVTMRRKFRKRLTIRDLEEMKLLYSFVLDGVLCYYFLKLIMHWGNVISLIKK